MKAILEFDIDDKKDSAAFDRALYADEMARALTEIRDAMVKINKSYKVGGEGNEAMNAALFQFEFFTNEIFWGIE